MIPSARDEPDGKVNQAVANIHRIWQETCSRQCAQLVFCDLSTPKDKGFSVYRDMADKLITLGVPRETPSGHHRVARSTINVKELAISQRLGNPPSNRCGAVVQLVEHLVRKDILKVQSVINE